MAWDVIDADNEPVIDHPCRTREDAEWYVTNTRWDTTLVKMPLRVVALVPKHEEEAP